MTIPLPPPVAGVPFDLETAAGRVAGYRLGEVGRSCSCTASTQRVPGSSSLRWRHGPAPTSRAGRLARMAPRIGPTRPTAGHSTASSSSASGLPRCSRGDLRRCRRALLPGQYVVVAARRIRSASAASSSSVRPDSAASRGAPAVHRGTSTASCADGDRSAAVRGARSAPGDPLVPPADLRGSGAGPAGVRAVLLADLPAARRIPGSAGVRFGFAQ